MKPTCYWWPKQPMGAGHTKGSGSILPNIWCSLYYCVTVTCTETLFGAPLPAAAFITRV